MWVDPVTATSRPEPSWWAKDSDHANGVAGSPVVPTTTIGGALGAEKVVGPDRSGGYGQ